MRAALWSLALLVLTSACATEEAARREEPARAEAQQSIESERACKCWKVMEGAEKVVEDTADGVAVRITTSDPVQVGPLREHVREMVARHHGGAGAGHHGSGCPHHGHEGKGGHHGEGKAMPPARATVEDIEGGVRVVLVPEDPSQVDVLRTQVREHVERMKTHRCPMKGAQGHAG